MATSAGRISIIFYCKPDEPDVKYAISNSLLARQVCDKKLSYSAADCMAVIFIVLTGTQLLI